MKIKVFQVNPELDQHNTLFRSYANAMMNAGQIDPSIYKTVFDGYIKARDLEDVFAVLNFNQPVGYNGHSMSVSDVLQIKRDRTADLLNAILQTRQNTEDSWKNCVKYGNIRIFKDVNILYFL